MNPYLVRSIVMLIVAIVFTLVGFEKLDLFYGATLAVLVYSVFDNYAPPKPLLDSKEELKVEV